MDDIYTSKSKCLLIIHTDKQLIKMYRVVSVKLVLFNHY